MDSALSVHASHATDSLCAKQGRLGEEVGAWGLPTAHMTDSWGCHSLHLPAPLCATTPGTALGIFLTSI